MQPCQKIISKGKKIQIYLGKYLGTDSAICSPFTALEVKTCLPYWLISCMWQISDAVKSGLDLSNFKILLMVRRRYESVQNSF
jgi:hypothetical protein